jgi:hypothetical protein
MKAILVLLCAVSATSLLIPPANKLYLPRLDRQLHLSSWSMSDPDTPPEVNPTRRDPDEPGPDIPIRLPVVDFGTSYAMLINDTNTVALDWIVNIIRWD